MADNAEEKWQLDTLKQIYEVGAYRIHFKSNPKYPSKTTGIFYIGFDDMYAYKDNIREKQGADYADASDPITATYPSLDDLVHDGWRLD